MRERLELVKAKAQPNSFEERVVNNIMVKQKEKCSVAQWMVVERILRSMSKQSDKIVCGRVSAFKHGKLWSIYIDDKEAGAPVNDEYVMSVVVWTMMSLDKMEEALKEPVPERTDGT